jgi:hypothetical protein
MDRKGPERARRRDDVSATRTAARAQVRVDAWRGEGVQITCSATSVRWRAHRSVPTQHTTSAGAEASLAARSTVALIAQKSQVAGASNRSPRATCSAATPTRRRARRRAGRRAGRQAGWAARHAWRGWGRPGTHRGLRSTLHRSCAPDCGRSEPQQATFCWSLPDHLPLRPDAPDAQNALSGDLVQKSSLSGKMVISPPERGAISPTVPGRGLTGETRASTGGLTSSWSAPVRSSRLPAQRPARPRCPAVPLVVPLLRRDTGALLHHRG